MRILIFIKKTRYLDKKNYFCILQYLDTATMKLNKIKIGLIGKDIFQAQLAKKSDKSFSTINISYYNRMQSFLNVSNEIAKILIYESKNINYLKNNCH